MCGQRFPVLAQTPYEKPNLLSAYKTLYRILSVY